MNSDGEWTGMLGMLHRGEIDLAFGSLIIDEDRFNYFQMIPFTLHRFTFATNQPKFQASESSFEKPFQTDVWLSCVLAYILTTIVLWIFANIHRSYMKKRAPPRDHLLMNVQKNIICEPGKYRFPQRNRVLQWSDNFSRKGRKNTTLKEFKALEPSNRSLSFAKLALEMIRIAFRQNLTLQNARTSSAKAVLGSWMIACLFLTYSYSVVLLSFMTLPPMRKPIKTVEQLANAVNNHNFKVFSHSSKAVLDIIQSNPLLNGIVEKINERKWFFNKDGYPKNLGNDSAIIDTTKNLRIRYDVKTFTNKFISDDMISVVQAGLAVSKTFCCKKELRWHINRIIETGEYKKCWSRALLKAFNDRPLEVDQSSIRPLSLYDFKSMFYFLIGGLAFAG
ncbi:hypothetical protein JTE90_018085, partial [Oedothorax gibbosus]